MIVRAALVLALTVLLGLTAASSFYLVGGAAALRGPSVLQASWPVIYPLQSVLVGLVAWATVRVVRRWLPGARLTAESVSVMVVVAWLAELLFVGSGILADDLSWTNGIAYWLMLTGGPIQPIAAIAGALIGLGPADSAGAADSAGSVNSAPDAIREGG